MADCNEIQKKQNITETELMISTHVILKKNRRKDKMLLIIIIVSHIHQLPLEMKVYPKSLNHTFSVSI